MVLTAFVIACRFAIWPTSRSPFSVNPTTEGVVRPPSLFGMIWVTPPSMTATHEFVVPRSIPITLPITSRLHAGSVPLASGRCLLCLSRYLHPRWPQELVPDLVSALEFLND